MSASQTTNQREDCISSFRDQFQTLVGNPPMCWQERLFCEHFVTNDIPAVIDLPTGLGKTMVMAIWLLARTVNASLPRRLVYVVDRRTVVDQATDLAKRLQEKVPQVFPCMANLAISTLRGQLADNRDWTRDPSRPAIIIGTVDMIGSRLLFSGYRSSYKQRPLDAGLLGQDSLLVLDEAHLSRPFEKLICALAEGGPFQTKCDSLPIKPMQVIRMSATSAESEEASSAKPFRLDTDPDSPTYDLKTDPDHETEKERNQTILRFNAKKRLTIQPIGEKDDLNEEMAKAAIELAEKPDLRGKRIVVFVRSPEDARDIASKIRNHAKPPKSKSNPDPKGRHVDSVELLTGTMRGLERDELVEKPVLKRFLDGRENPDLEDNKQPVFLVSTSAGEVGFDLNADHLVGDAAPLDSWIQRLGRVNRRGSDDETICATIRLLYKPIKTVDKGTKPKKLEGIEKSIATTLHLLNGIEGTEKDVSPKNLAALKESDSWKKQDKQGKSDYNYACSPPPTMVELTDILLDNWSMTSITERMPGRPEVGPWLRGIDREQAETSIAWRAELELFRNHPNPARALKAVFAKHRIRPHECLTTNSNHVVDFLKEVVKPKGGRPDLSDTLLAIRLPRGEIFIRTIGKLIENPGILYAEPTLILPATFGGLDEAGMLSTQAIHAVPGPNDPALRSLDVADHLGYEQRIESTPRLRVVIRRTDEGSWVPESLPGGVRIPDRLVLQESYRSSTALFDDLRKARTIDGNQARLRVRLVQRVKFDDEGDAVTSLVLLAPVVDLNKSEDQTLDDHVEAVKREAEMIAERLELKGRFRDALIFAAQWHDEGKKAEIWQRFVCRPDESSAYKGKSSETRDPKSLRGYRHEFGSLMRLLHSSRHQPPCTLPSDANTCDLALHLIATHHGFGRPHFVTGMDRDFRSIDCDSVHTEAIRRFARLQRKYGWWRLAWLENLLRCADALASADDVSEDDVGEGNEEIGEGS